MSVPYNRPVRNVALRLGALYGSDSAALETSYTQTSLTLADFDGGVPFEAIKDAVLMAEEQLAQAIADSGEHPWRAYLASQTANVANNGALPSVDSASKPIIGIYGAVSDATDGTICVEMPLDLVKRRAVNANTQFKLPVYWFNITGRYISHTRTNVRLEVCTYDRSAQSTSLEAGGNILLPDVLEPAYVCGALATFGEKLGEQAGYFQTVFTEQLISIRRGLANVVAEVPTSVA